jgi:hypothetical protein
VIHRFSIRVTLIACLILASRCCLAAEATLGELKLTEQNYEAWRDHILPAKTDLGWQEIPWLTTFQDGILDANQRDLPLLFWTMNGHPLGCT